MRETRSRVQKLAESLKLPRAASAYGIDTRELRHNAFLHFLLQSPLATALLGQIAAHNVRASAQTACDWHPLADEEIVIRSTQCDRSKGSGRPDETIECQVASGKVFIVLVEMKIRAPRGESQLSDYVTREQVARPHVKAIGMLLRIPGNDRVDNRRYPILNGQGYKSCILSALSTAGVQFHEKAHWLVKDYLETLDLLNVLDETILSDSDTLKEIYHEKHTQDDIGLLREWLTENWSWVNVRIARDVEGRIAVVHGDWITSAYGERDGANVDIAPKELSLDRQDAPEAPSACRYFQWKIGQGLQLRSAVGHYSERAASDDVNKQESKLMHELCIRAKQTLPADTWEHRTGTGRSRMIALVKDESMNVDTIVQALQELVVPLLDALRKVVDEVRVCI